MNAPAEDRHWHHELRDALLCAGLLVALLCLIDTAAGLISPPRALLWTALGALLLAVLVPPRVRAGEGWLEQRGLCGTKRVHTDLLVSVRWLDGVSQRLLLRDTYGVRIELDPHVLTRNPELWARVDADARTSVERGLLRCGATALRQLSRRIDSETAHVLFRISGLR
ncbi:hypothetical protein [Streptomyces indicus]|uniref:PH domain-containing protein n=1 Tax=Streptomyces indicus TaxID=417292 RepID=A0A1G9CJZ2_9ACTN|nr:hypothetical protein [Streptomyces indicus]SDK52007.1 hypothetical protein SAMN05421806_108174 [Streptomyces indicus]